MVTERGGGQVFFTKVCRVSNGEGGGGVGAEKFT